MTNEPLNSGEQGKLLIFTLLFAPSVFLGVGVIPAIFLGFGIFLMKKNEDFSSVETAVKYFKGYVWLALIGCVLFWLYFYFDRAMCLNDESNYSIYYTDGNLCSSQTRFKSMTFAVMIFTAIAIAYLIIIQVLFLNPLESHREWVSVNGIFSSKPKSEPNTGAEIDIIKGEKLKHYSVADELLKWAKLKEDGHITEEEFSEARKKILKRS